MAKNKLTLIELEAYVANLIDADKVSNASFVATTDNIVGLLDKIGKITTLDTDFKDKLPELDGEFLKYGKTVEEYHEDLSMPLPFDRSGTGALTFQESSYRPVFYSYKIDRQKLKMSIPYGDIEGAVNDGEEFARIIAMKHKRLFDSEQVLTYQLKRELIGKVIDLAETEWEDGVEFNYQTDYAVNSLVVDDDTTTTKRGIVVKNYDASEVVGVTDWDSAVAKGYIIELHLIEEIAKPVDTTTGEAFVKAVKKVIETAKDDNEGNSLNGNTLGATSTLKLYLNHGILPSIEVDTLSGAFNKEQLGFNVEAKVIRDFGSADSSYYGILIDTRGIKLHPNYRAMRSNENGDGDFMNIFLHLGFTPYASRNTFIHIFKQPSTTSNKVAVEKKVAIKKVSK